MMLEKEIDAQYNLRELLLKKNSKLLDHDNEIITILYLYMCFFTPYTFLNKEMVIRYIFLPK